MLNKKGYLLIDSMLFMKILMVVIVELSVMTVGIHRLKTKTMKMYDEVELEIKINEIYKTT